MSTSSAAPFSHVFFFALYPLSTANPRTENWTAILGLQLFLALSQPPPLPSLLIAAASLLGRVWAMPGLEEWGGGGGGVDHRASLLPQALLGLFQLVGRSDPTSPSPTLPLRNQRPLLAQNPRAGPCNCKLIIQQILLSPPSACGGPSAFCWLCSYGF